MLIVVTSVLNVATRVLSVGEAATKKMSDWQLLPVTLYFEVPTTATTVLFVPTRNKHHDDNATNSGNSHCQQSYCTRNTVVLLYPIDRIYCISTNWKGHELYTYTSSKSRRQCPTKTLETTIKLSLQLAGQQHADYCVYADDRS